MGRDTSDEFYVLDLCDQALGEVGLRQHRFDWLLGDPGATGARARLPVDGHWPKANVVVEHRERQHDQPIPAHGIRLIVITPMDLDATPRGRLRRNRLEDLRSVVRLIGDSLR